MKFISLPFLIFIEDILRVDISKLAIPLFTQSAYIGDFPFKFFLFPYIFLHVTPCQKTTEKSSVGAWLG